MNRVRDLKHKQAAKEKIMIKRDTAAADSEDDEVVGGEVKRVAMKKGGGTADGSLMKSCQADNCSADLTDAKTYHRRHKVCELHAKAQVVAVAGIRQRFCQQCSRFLLPTPFTDFRYDINLFNSIRRVVYQFHTRSLFYKSFYANFIQQFF